MALGNAQ